MDKVSTITMIWAFATDGCPQITTRSNDKESTRKKKTRSTQTYVGECNDVIDSWKNIAGFKMRRQKKNLKIHMKFKGRKM